MLFTLEELASYLPETADNPERAQLLQDLTFGLIYETVPQATAEPSVIAKGIALEVAARAYRNAEGWTSEAVDDWSGRREGSRGAAGVYLTSDERSTLLGLDATTARPRVRSVRLRSWSVPQL